MALPRVSPLVLQPEQEWPEEAKELLVATTNQHANLVKQSILPVVRLSCSGGRAPLYTLESFLPLSVEVAYPDKGQRDRFESELDGEVYVVCFVLWCDATVSVFCQGLLLCELRGSAVAHPIDPGKWVQLLGERIVPC